MKNRYIVFSFVSAFLALQSCKQQSISKNVSADYKFENYGEIPLLPDNLTLERGQFFPVSDSAGSMQMAVTKKKTELRVGDKESGNKFCPIAKDAVVSVVAIVKTVQKAQFAIAQIKDPCVPKGQSAADPNAEKLFEGYVPFSDLEFRNSRFAEKDISQISQEEIDGVSVTHIGGSVDKTPAEILSGGDADAIKELIRQNQGDPNLGVGGGFGGCLAVEQSIKLVSGKEIYCGTDGVIAGSQVQIAKTSLNCMARAADFRNAKTSLYLSVYGKASKWVVSSHKGSPPSGVVTHETGISMGKKTFDGTNLLTVLPFDNIIAVNDWQQTDVYFFVEGLDESGKSIGNSCIHRFTLASPIALDLSISQRPPRTIEDANNKVRFDLKGNGRKELVGWIYPYMGFLALDWNNNGRIDNGRELFGEFAAGMDSQKFANGYLALATLDSDGNKKIDSRDERFANLRIWVDENIDGISQFHEIKPLSFYNITSLDVEYESRDTTKDISNRIPYRSKYYGPKHCIKGCATYDIYFGSELTVLQANKSH